MDSEIKIVTCDALPKDVIGMEGATGWTFLRTTSGVIKCNCGGVIFTPVVENGTPNLSCNRCGERM